MEDYCPGFYGLTLDELRHTSFGVDPKEVYGDDIPGETFRVLKEKEIKQWGSTGDGV